MARTKQTARKPKNPPQGRFTGAEDRPPPVVPKQPPKRKTKPGVAALREIKRLQKTTKLIISKWQMSRYVCFFLISRIIVFLCIYHSHVSVKKRQFVNLHVHVHVWGKSHISEQIKL